MRQQHAEVGGFTAVTEVGKNTNQTFGRRRSRPPGIESVAAVGSGGAIEEYQRRNLRARR
jgi:hypothetical protein